MPESRDERAPSVRGAPRDPSSADERLLAFPDGEPGLDRAITRVVREVLNDFPAYFSVIGADGRYRLCCRSCESLFGRPRHQIEGEHVANLMGSAASAQAGPLLADALSGRSAHGEIRIVGADGKPRVLRAHMRPLRSESGVIDAVFTFAYDVTEMRDIEANLRQSESEMKCLIELNPDLITIVNRQFKVRFINHTEPDPATRREELIGIDILDLTPPDRRSQLAAQYEEVWRTGKPMDVEAPILWRGQPRWFSSRLVALPNGNDPPREMLIVSREITERVAMERALRESETRFRQFAEALDDVIWIHDREPERITFVNGSYEKVWGRPRQTLYDDPRAWIETIVEEDRERVRSNWMSIIDGPARNFDVEYRIVRPDGSIRWIHDYGVAIFEGDGPPIRLTGIARDITTKKQVEEEREAFQKQLLETQKLESLGVLAGGIAHDFNNLLAGIVGNVNLAQHESLSDPSLRAYLAQIESISLRAGELCKQMLAYAGKGKLVVASLDLNGLIDEITHLLSISISKKVSLQVQHATNLPPVRGDASQLRQVLLNLVINASEAFGDRIGQIRISTGATEMTAEDLSAFLFGVDLQPGPYLFLEVSDNGPGMTSEVASRIFEPFFTTKFTGRGLGLAAVQGIMRGHGGAIRVTSKPGKGSAFTLLFPPATEPIVPVAPAPPLVEAPPQEGCALVVDDEAIISSSLSLMLESFGFDVIVAGDGRQGIELFAQHKDTIRIVLLDLTMPIVSGEEAYREMQRIDSSIPIVFMSGYMEQDVIDRIDAGAFAGFLQKPFRMEDLERLVTETVQRKQ